MNGLGFQWVNHKEKLCKTVGTATVCYCRKYELHHRCHPFNFTHLKPADTTDSPRVCMNQKIKPTVPASLTQQAPGFPYCPRKSNT